VSIWQGVFISFSMISVFSLFLVSSPVVIIALTEVFDVTIPSKILLSD
jgi:hypothetical protein